MIYFKFLIIEIQSLNSYFLLMTNHQKSGGEVGGGRMLVSCYFLSEDLIYNLSFSLKDNNLLSTFSSFYDYNRAQNHNFIKVHANISLMMYHLVSCHVWFLIIFIILSRYNSSFYNTGTRQHISGLGLDIIADN